MQNKFFIFLFATLSTSVALSSNSEDQSCYNQVIPILSSALETTVSSPEFDEEVKLSIKNQLEVNAQLTHNKIDIISIKRISHEYDIGAPGIENKFDSNTWFFEYKYRAKYQVSIKYLKDNSNQILFVDAFDGKKTEEYYNNGIRIGESYTMTSVSAERQKEFDLLGNVKSDKLYCHVSTHEPLFIYNSAFSKNISDNRWYAMPKLKLESSFDFTPQ